MMDATDFSFMDFDLFEVARNECFSILNIALENLELYNFSVDTQDPQNGNTLLHYATFSGNIETVNKLLSLSAYTNILNIHGETALHQACYKGYLKIVKLLLQNNAKINAVDFSGETPIFKSVRGGNTSLTKFLISQEDIILNTANNVNQKLIHVGAIFNDTYLVNMLLENGEDPNIITDSGETPLQLAVQYGHIDIMDILVKKDADLNVRDTHNCTLLHLAVQANQETVFKKLLSYGLDVNSQDSNGTSPLHLAVESNLTSIVSLLLQNKADINKCDLDDYTPLHIAARHRNGFDILEFLIKNNAKLDAITVHGDLPLHVAAAVGNIKAFTFLYSKKYINCVNTCGLSPSKIAQENGCFSITNFVSEFSKPTQKIPVLMKLHKRKS